MNWNWEGLVAFGVAVGTFFLLGRVNTHENAKLQPTADYTLEIINADSEAFAIWRSEQFVTRVYPDERTCINHPGIGVLLAKDNNGVAVHQGIVSYANFHWRWHLRPDGSTMSAEKERCVN